MMGDYYQPYNPSGLEIDYEICRSFDLDILNSRLREERFRGRWTREEHLMFINGLEKYGKRWSKIAALVKTRTLTQIRTHAQKYYLKLSKAKHNNMSSSSDRDGDKESDNSQEQEEVRYGQVLRPLEEEEYDDYEEETEEGEDSEELNAAQSLIDLRSVYDKSDQSTSTMIQRQDEATFNCSMKKLGGKTAGKHVDYASYQQQFPLAAYFSFRMRCEHRDSATPTDHL